MQMKSLLKRMVAASVRREWCWRILNRLVVIPAKYAQIERMLFVNGREEQSILRETFPDLTVKHGPFRGLKYPRAQAIESLVLPKLLGSYEREIQDFIEAQCGANHPIIADIGCAEGYYAVGLAMRSPASKVYAFDIDEAAQQLCGEMAQLNGVKNRVNVGGACGPAELISLMTGQTGLVISDCEGYERELFTPDVVAALSRSHVIVELHEFYAAGVTEELIARFRSTHRVERVPALHDELKLRTYDFPEVRGLDKSRRLAIVSEGRPVGMEWLIASPKGPNGTG
jgi:hypothetical protein